MSNNLNSLRARAAAATASHWANCEQGGLPHRSDSCSQVLALFSRFFDALDAIPRPVSLAAISKVVGELYIALNDLNEAYDHGLLETNERELLVPFVIEAVETVGLPSDQFDGGEPPGSDHRDF